MLAGRLSPALRCCCEGQIFFSVSKNIRNATLRIFLSTGKSSVRSSSNYLDEAAVRVMEAPKQEFGRA